MGKLLLWSLLSRGFRQEGNVLETEVEYLAVGDSGFEEDLLVPDIEESEGEEEDLEDTWKEGLPTITFNPGGRDIETAMQFRKEEEVMRA